MQDKHITQENIIFIHSLREKGTVWMETELTTNSYTVQRIAVVYSHATPA